MQEQAAPAPYAPLLVAALYPNPMGRQPRNEAWHEIWHELAPRVEPLPTLHTQPRRSMRADLIITLRPLRSAAASGIGEADKVNAMPIK